MFEIRIEVRLHNLGKIPKYQTYVEVNKKFSLLPFGIHYCGKMYMHRSLGLTFTNFFGGNLLTLFVS